MKKNYSILALTLLLFFGGNALGQTAQSIPYSSNPGLADLTTANGWIQSGIGSDYADAAVKLKFDAAGDYAYLRIASSPSTLTYYLKGNSLSGSYSFQIFESTDGSTWGTAIQTITTGISSATGGTQWSVSLNSTTRYIKWQYTTKANGNIGMGTIAISAPNPSIAISSAHPAAANILQGSSDNIVGGIQLDVTTATATLNSVSVTTAGTYTASDISANGFKLWLSSSATSISGATQLSTNQAAVGTGGTVAVTGLTNTISSGTTRYILLTANIAGSATINNTFRLASTAFTNITFSSGTKTGTNPVPAGASPTNDQTIVAPSTPTLSATALTAFGTQCTGGTYGPNSFTLSGTSLTGTDVSVSGNAVYTFATSSGGTYSNPLTLTAYNGSSPGSIYVKFSPAAALNYDGNITISGGGATSINVAASGSGIAPVAQAVSSSAATVITGTTATLNGNLTTLGVCPASTEKGFVWSATATDSDPFVDDAGVTKTTVAGIVTGAYNTGLTGLANGTNYTFKAYVYDGTTYTYGATLNFTTLAPPANDACASSAALTVGAAATGTLVNATPHAGFTENDVWYSFTPTCTGSHTITLGSFTGADIDFKVYSSNCPASSSVSALYSQTAGSTGTTEINTNNYTSGITYYIRAYIFSGTPTTFTIGITSTATPQLTLAATAAPAIGNISPSTTDVPVYGFSLAPNACATTYDFTGITITKTGTTTTSDLSNFRIFYDANSNGLIDGGESSVSGSGIALSASMAFTVSGQTGLTATRRYLLVADVDALATNGKTFTGSATATGVTANISATGTAAGNQQTVVVIKAEPTNYPSGFACGTVTLNSIPLNWTDASTGVLPDGYLIKWSSTSYAAITAPSDGTAEADGATTKNIAQGVGTYTAASLSSGTTYYFKIWSYTNSGTNINYKLVSEPQTSCTTTSAPVAKTYKLISSTSDLEVGKKYLIVNTLAAGAGNAMGSQNTNNRSISSITVVSGTPVQITTTAASSSSGTEPFEFTLGGSTGAWTLYDPLNSGYLYAASSSSNYLRTQTTNDANGQWAISFSSNVANIIAQGSFTRNVMQYNTGGLFSCYSSASQSAIYLFKEDCTAPSDPTSSFSTVTPAVCGSTATNYTGTVPSGETYYWQTSASGVSTANPVSSAYTVSSSSPIYVRSLKGTCWSTSAASTSVTVTQAVSIGTQPANTSVVTGNAASFSVVASNGSGYQWQLNTGSGWNDIVGETGTSYNIATATSGMNGYQYRCVVKGTSPCGDVTSNPATLTITNPAVNTISNQSNVYGSTVSLTVTATAAVSSWSATLPAGLSINSSGVITGTLTEDVINSPFSSSVTANFTVGGSNTKNFTWTITPKTLTISGLSGNNKVYDGNTTATLGGAASLVGIVGSDNVTLSGTPTATFNNKNVGTGKPISVTGYTLSGTKSGNYTLTQPTGITGNITAKALTVTGAVAQDKTYDGTTAATITGATLDGVVSPDVVTVSGGGTFASANAGTGISVTASLTLGGVDAGNYTLTQPTGLSANINKANPVFTTSTISISVGATYALPGANISSTSGGAFSYSITGGGNATLSGTTITGVVVGTETLTVTQAATANYNAGSTTVTVSVIMCTPPLWEENFDYGCVDNSSILSIPEASANWTINTVSPNYNFNYDAGGNLSYSGYTPTGGGAARFVRGASRDVIKRLIKADGSTVTSGTVYSSFLVNFNNNTGNGDEYFFTFKNQNNTFRGRIHADNSTSSGTGTKFKFGVSKYGSSTSDFQSGEYNFDTTYLCVVKYEFISGSNNDRISLWVFNSGMPASETEAGAATIYSTSGADWETGSSGEMKYIVLRQASAGADGLIDGIRVGTTWEDVACSATPSAKSYTWTGNTSTVWANPNNWSPNTGYPTAIDNITISTSTPNKLNITDCRTVKNFTLNGTGDFDMSATGSLTINGTVTYDDANNAGAASNLNCDSYVYITKNTTGAESVIVPPLTYGNLDIMGGNRTFLSGKTIKICSIFNVEPDDASPKLYTYTVAGSAVEYISSAINWVLTPFTYYNLKFSGTGDFSVGYSLPEKNKTINVLNDYTQTAGTVYLGETSSKTGILNIDGNMTLIGGTFNMNKTAGGKGILNLKGDLTVTAGATLYATSTTVANTNFNFTGTYDALLSATIQTINVASIGTTRNRYVGFNIKTGAYAQLSGNNLELGNGGAVSVEAGSTLDFGFNGSTALVLKNVSGATTTGFTMIGKAKLIITHPNGIDRWQSASDRATDGNVQIDGSRNYSTTGIYHYMGKTPQQRLGDGILFGGISGKYVIVELDALSTKLLLEGNAGTSTSAFSELTDIGLSNTDNGGLKIIQGTVVGTATSDFMSTGNLEMTGGLYQIAYPYGSSDVVPRLSGSYTLTGGTIELNGSTAQTLRGGNSPNTPNYYNLKMSGNNTVSINNTPINISNNLYITGNSIFNSQGNSVTGDAGLTMDGGKWSISKITNAQPELKGINTSYTLTGGTVEFYGSGATDQQQIRGNFRPASPLKINYYNIEVNAAAANYSTISGAGNVDLNSSFTLSGTMNVNSPAVLRMDKEESIDGAGNFKVNNGAGLLYGGSVGSPSPAIVEGLQASGTGINDGNIRTTSRSFSQLASYGFISAGDMPSGDGLPSTVAGLYVYKTNAADVVTLNNTATTTVNGILSLQNGKILSSGTNKLILEKVGTASIVSPANAGGVTNMGYENSYVIGSMGRITNAADVENIFPIGSASKYGPISLTPKTSTSQTYTCDYVSTGYGTYTLDPDNSQQLDHVSKVEFWNVSSSLTPSANDDAKVKLFWRTHSQVSATNTDWSNLRVAHFDGTNWNTEGNSPSISGSTPVWGWVQSDIYAADYSPFTLGTITANNPLPVELTYFSAQCNGDNSVTVRWSTASELNSKEFILERSVNGIQYLPIATLPAAGNSTSVTQYAYTDNSPFDPTYYRLKEVDLDGETQQFNATESNCGTKVNGASIYFQPGIGIIVDIQHNKDEAFTFSLYQYDGKLILTEERDLENGYNKVILSKKINQLAHGIYILKVTHGDKIYTQKLWIH